MSECHHPLRKFSFVVYSNSTKLPRPPGPQDPVQADSSLKSFSHCKLHPKCWHPLPPSQRTCTHTSGAALSHHALTVCLHTSLFTESVSLQRGFMDTFLGFHNVSRGPFAIFLLSVPVCTAFRNQDRANYYHFNCLVLTRNQQEADLLCRWCMGTNRRSNKSHCTG